MGPVYALSTPFSPAPRSLSTGYTHGALVPTLFWVPLNHNATGQPPATQLSLAAAAQRCLELDWSEQARRTVVAAISAQPPISGPPLGSLLSDCDLEEVVHLAISQGVAGRALESLGELLPSGPRTRLLAQVREDALRHFGFLAILDTFSTAFEAADVDWVVLKGPVLAELIYGATSRGYTDLDLMVPAHQLRQAIAALETAGADLPVTDWALKTRTAYGELSMAYAGARSSTCTGTW